MTLSAETNEQGDHLIVHNPDGSVDKMPIPTEVGAELSLGRELDNDISLSDPRVSRHHARVRRVSEEMLEITDVGSVNGTIVGTTLVEAEQWQSFAPGQVAQIGDTRLVWEQSVTSQSTVPMVPVSGPNVSPSRAGQRRKRDSTSIIAWGIAAAALIAIILLAWFIFSVLRSGESEIAATTPQGGPADISQQTPQVAADQPEAATATPPEPTPIAVVPLEPAFPSMYVENIRFLPVISGALFDPQHIYMIVRVRVENLGDEAFNISLSQFNATTDDGTVLREFGQEFAPSEFRRLGVSNRFDNLRLSSGGSVAEELVFFLDTKPYDLTINFRPTGFEPIEVSLGTISANTELAVLLGTPTVEPTAVLASADVTPTLTLEPTPTSTPIPPRADGFARTVPQSSLVGTIAFGDFNGSTYDLYFGNVATGEVNLWRNQSSQPSFSHDGTRIAYHSWAEGSRGLITSNLDHSNGFLVGAFLEDQLPTWSPDGSEVMILSRRTGTRQSELYKVPSNQERPAARLILEGEYPTWGADGTVIFKGWVTTGIGLRIASSGLTDYQPLTDDDSDTAPSVSPDGNQVVFMSGRAGNWDVYLINTDGSGLVQLTNDPADDGLPTWSPDGQAIAFVSNRGGPWAVWAMTPRGTGIRQLFTMQGGPDGFVASEPTTDTTRGWAEERLSWAQ